MKFSKLTKIQVCGLWAVTMAVTGVAAFNMSADAAAAEGKLRAGVALALEPKDMMPIDVTAGVSDVLMDTRAAGEADSMKMLAGPAADGSGEELPGTEQKAEQEDDVAALCGYKNLGIANIKEGNLNIREEATTDSKVAGKMTKHNACEILGEEDGWLKVKSGRVDGYVKAEYILTGDAALEVAEKEIVTVATVTGTATLRVREEASTDSATLALVGEGESLVVQEERDGWYYVEVDDEKGYISGEFVEISLKLPTAQTIKELTKDDGFSDVRMQLVQYALQFVGNRYVWGGTSLTNGVDCSGFTMQVYAHFGIGLPHHSGSQPGYGTRINASEARPGDLFFYGSGSRIGHVAIYIGNGQIVHASNERTGIKVSNAYYRTPICVVSYLP